MPSSNQPPPRPETEVAQLQARIAELERTVAELHASHERQERERRQAEEARSWLIAILEATPDLIGYIGIDGGLQYLNRAWRELRGLPDDVDLATLDVTSWQPAWVSELAFKIGLPTARREGIWQGEVVIYDHAGNSVPTRQTILALYDSHGKLARLATVLHDLRAERAADQVRIELERRLRDAQRLESLGVMAGGIAHDFNNILTTILGNVDLALLDANLDPATRHGLEHVAAGAQRAAELTRQMLAFAGRGQLLVRSTDLNALLVSLSSTLQATPPFGVTFKLDLEPAVPLVQADEVQLHQLLASLVTNAKEALVPEQRPGAITLQTRVAQVGQNELDALAPGEQLAPGAYAQLTVEDNGRGIDRATAGRIFDPFFSTKFLGRGLGLAAARGIVRAHQGALQIVSEPGLGTRVHVWLPIAPRRAAQLSARPNRTGSVLIVGVAPELRETFEQNLSPFGLAPIFLRSGDEALARLAAGLPDLAFILTGEALVEREQQHIADAVGALYPGTAHMRLQATDDATILDALQAMLKPEP